MPPNPPPRLFFVLPAVACAFALLVLLAGCGVSASPADDMGFEIGCLGVASGVAATGARR